MPVYDPSKRNYSFKTPIDCVNGTVFRNCNFTQESPWTEPFTSTGLVFEDCNLSNCLLPADAIVKVNGKVKTSLPELMDGRKVPAQYQFRLVTESVEEEPGVMADHTLQKRYKVTGTPTSPVETYMDFEDLGPVED